MEIQKSPKIAKKYTCELCNNICNKESDYKKHLATRKHIKNANGNKSTIQEIDKIAVFFTCTYCNKKYKTNSGLWKHNKICTIPIETPNIVVDSSNNIIEILINENKDFKNMIMDLVKSNNDLQKQMIDVCKNNSINNNVINSHNKTFNLQLFLNEECKDAMNMSEFIKSIELQLTDLENFAEVDYTQGMSNLIIKNLKNTDMYKRPVHCSDAKRETLYIKEENKWEKEGPENKKMIGAVRAVDKKNIDLLFKWKDKYPTCLNTDSQYNDQYIKLLRSVISGSEENVNKVIKKISKEVVIDK